MDRIERLLNDDPERLSISDLYDIKLSQFSKAIGSKLSSRRIINAYLRWLEAQRTGTAGDHWLKEHLWETLQKQWIASLKAKGFTESEIIKKVSEWNEEKRSVRGRSILTASLIHGVFESGFYDKNTPPYSHYTEQASSKTSLKRNYSGDHEDYENSPKKRAKHLEEESYDPNEPVPPHYICKRCHRQGHFLLSCPTNLDPTWDTKPGEDYYCRGCDMKGDHYFTLCYRNTNPLSLYQLRISSARKERHSRLADTFGKRTPPQYKPKEIKRLRFEDDELISQETNKADDSGKGPKKSSDTFDFRFDIQKAKLGSGGKPDLITSYNSKEVRKTEKGVESERETQPSIFPARVSGASHEKVESIIGITMRPKVHFSPDVGEEKEEILKSPIEEFGEQETPIPFQPSQVQKVPRALPKSLSKEIVNKRPRRPTALEMWDLVDKEREENRQRGVFRDYERARMEREDSPNTRGGHISEGQLDSIMQQLTPDRGPSQDDILPDAPDTPEDQEMSEVPTSLQPLSNFASGSLLEDPEPQVLRVTQLEADTAQWEVRGLFQGYEITAISVWKPTYIRPPATKSAFVSLSSNSRAEAERCCRELCGKVVRGMKVWVTRINEQEVYEQAMAEYKEDVKGFEEFKKRPMYISYSDQHRQILQHLRLTAIFDPSETESRPYY